MVDVNEADIEAMKLRLAAALSDVIPKVQKMWLEEVDNLSLDHESGSDLFADIVFSFMLNQSALAAFENEELPSVPDPSREACHLAMMDMLSRLTVRAAAHLEGSVGDMYIKQKDGSVVADVVGKTEGSA